jgi:hypothetical protein
MTWKMMIAKEARAACNWKRNNHPVTTFKIFYTGPDLFYNSHELMPECHRPWLRQTARVNMKV